MFGRFRQDNSNNKIAEEIIGMKTKQIKTISAISKESSDNKFLI
jgi:hypothetical protein